MHRYHRLEPLLDSLAAFLHNALCRGDATCAIATQQVRDGLNERLRARGWDTEAHPRYRAIDVSDALRRCMRNGLPDENVLQEIAAELDDYRTSIAEGETSRLTVFGNMVVTLSEQGNIEAVLALERAWNTLTHGLPFLTLCAYETAAP